MAAILLRDRHRRLTGVALVDDEDWGRLASRRWHLMPVGYAQTGAVALMHREIMGLEPGDGKYVDHINGDKLDNRRANLRVVTNAENAQNRRGGRGTSAHRGVSWDKPTGRWKAQVTLNGRNHFLGRFDSEDHAARVAADFRREHMPCSEADKAFVYRTEEPSQR